MTPLLNAGLILWLVIGNAGNLVTEIYFRQFLTFRNILVALDFDNVMGYQFVE